MLKRLTDSHQIDLIANYAQKWQVDRLSQWSGDRVQVEPVIASLYAMVNRDVPTLIFTDDPRPYYAQVFSSNFSGEMRDRLNQHFHAQSQHYFLAATGENIARKLSQQFKLPVERLQGQYLRQTLALIQAGQPEAYKAASKIIYTDNDHIRLKTIAQVDWEFTSHFGRTPSNQSHLTDSTVDDLDTQLHRFLALTKEILVKIVDGGGIPHCSDGWGCFDRAFLTATGARLDYLINGLGFPGDDHGHLLRSLIQNNVQMIYPYENTCIISINSTIAPSQSA